MARWNSFIHFLSEVQQTDPSDRQKLVDELLDERKEWPWVEGSRATFVYTSYSANNVAVNLDIIKEDPPLQPLVELEGTSLWYLQRYFETTDLLDYMLAIDDPMTPLAEETNLQQRIQNHWRSDPRNPQLISTNQTEVSVLRMGRARPFPNWQLMRGVKRGRIYEHTFSSAQMNFDNRKVWFYTPPDYDQKEGIMYPLLLLLDGQWAVGPIQVPYIADALIKHNRLQPIMIAMIQSGGQSNRIRDYVSNDSHYSAMLTELLPFLQQEYLIDSTNLGIGGVGISAIAAAHAGLKNPAVFSHLMMLSPPLGRGPGQEKLVEYAQRFDSADLLPKRIFQSVGRYEMKTRFYQPGIALATILRQRQATRGDVSYKFVELGSAHSLAAFKSVLPEALTHIFPSQAGVG